MHINDPLFESLRDMMNHLQDGDMLEFLQLNNFARTFDRDNGN